MGWRYRKSIKIAPGIKLNVGKKSMGVSIGGKHAGVSVNSKTGVTTRASIPGSGLSYTQRVGGKKNRSRRTSSRPPARAIARSEQPVQKIPVVLRTWYIVLAVLCVIGGLANLPANWEAAICGVGVGGVMLFLRVKKRRELQAIPEDPSGDPESQDGRADRGEAE